MVTHNRPGPTTPASATEVAGAQELADAMFTEALTAGQSARTVVDEGRAAAVRDALRTLGRSSAVRLRTARTGDVVVVARLDAALWSDDAATMRAKLSPPS